MAKATIPPTPPDNTLVVVLVALLGSGIATTLIVSYRDRKFGPVRIREMEEHAADMAVHKLTAALQQSEKDLAKALARIELLESQIGTLTLRIAQLETDLALANTDRNDLRSHLATARTEREDLIARLARLQAKVGGRRQEDPS